MKIKDKNCVLAVRIIAAVEKHLGQEINPIMGLMLANVIGKEIEKFEQEQVPRRDPERSYEI